MLHGIWRENTKIEKLLDFFRIFEWYIDELESRKKHRFRENLAEILFFLDSKTERSKTLGEFHEIRIPEREPEPWHSPSFLFPFDHSIGTIIEDYDREIELQTNGRFDISEIHHESTVARDTDDLSIG